MLRSAIHVLSVALSMLLLSLQSPMEAQLAAPVPQRSLVLEKARALSRQHAAMSGTILLTWRTGGVTHQSHGTVAVQRPNLGRIVLEGDYPERLLISNGKVRYLAATTDKFEEAPMDGTGAGIDSPWWGLPYRFFFTGSVNPFGSAAEPATAYNDLPGDSEHAAVGGVFVKGGSPMGPYTEKLFFNATGDLVESSVQFGEGPGAAVFEARLTHVSHAAIPATSFNYTAPTGQVARSNSDGMLPLGVHAPAFTLRTPEGRPVSLRQELQGMRAVLINFWYYNCAPCRIENPQFEELYEQFAHQGFTILSIDKGDTAATVTKYIGTAGLTFPMVLGGEIAKGSVFELYKATEAFPYSYLVDGEGRIVYRSSGADIEGLKKALNGLGFE